MTILWDTARRLKSTVIDHRLSLVMRLEVACLVIALSSVAIGELLRLSANGQAARA
jgi:hypothetical protein